ncbi:MAG: hypothetical protein ACRYGF_00725 [Janthinobacterium lividum]
MTPGQIASMGDLATYMGGSLRTIFTTFALSRYSPIKGPVAQKALSTAREVSSDRRI